VATGSPTAWKNFSWPAGTQTHSSRAGCLDALRKECGALAGTLMVSPAWAICFAAAEGQFDLALENGEHLLEVVAMGRRAAAGRDVHVEDGEAAVRVLAGENQGVGVARQRDVGQGLVHVGPRRHQIAPRVVGWDGRLWTVFHSARPVSARPAPPASRTR